MSIKNEDFVTVDYEGRLESGEIFDSSKHGEHSHPLKFQVGSGHIIRGFNDAVIGMEIGEEKEITIFPADAYGEYKKDLEKEIPKSIIQGNECQEIQKNMILLMASPDGRQFPVKIIDVKNDKVIIDLNHPLAGKKLIFKIKILEVSNSNN